MIKRSKRILVATAIGLAVCVGGIWVLTRVLNEGMAPRYQGQSLFYWVERANSPEPAASNQACEVLNTTIIPQLTDAMFHDTNDSRIRLALIDQLNSLPGVQIYFTVAEGRRTMAAAALGEIGSHAKAAIPDLIKVLKGSDPAPRAGAASALGKIHSEPETIIPLLVGLLDDPQDGVPEGAATALGQFGSLSKAAVPKLLELSKVPDKDLQVAVSIALKQIDPEAAAKAGVR
jgi:hypothetical protein